MRTTSTFSIWFFSASTALLACRPDLPSNVNVLHVTAELPPGLDVEVHRDFESVPKLLTCKSISMTSGDFVPLHEDIVTKRNASGGQISVPLVWEERSLCSWRYRNASVRLVNTKAGMDIFSLNLQGGDLAHAELFLQAVALGCENTVTAECLRCQDKGDGFTAVECRAVLRKDDTHCESNRNGKALHINVKATFLKDEPVEWEECRKLAAKNATLQQKEENNELSGEEPMANTTKMDVSGMDMDAGYNVSVKKGDRLHLNVTKEPPETIRLRLAADKDNPASMDDKFRLFSTGGEGYDKTLSVRDDMVPNDGYLDLLYEGVNSSLYYSMEVIPGNNGEKYFIFENRKFE